MAAFFSTQLDFIFFFYGLAFILLGSICLGIARGGRRQTPWLVLAAFGFVHGASEWLDLLALIAGDTPAFAMARFCTMTGSFVLLFEFARLEAVRLGFKMPGRWIYAPMMVFVAWGAHLAGLNGASTFARYAIALTGALGTGAVLACHARDALPAEKRWIASAVIGFVLYALAAGVVVPPVAGWAGDVIDYADFSGFTGVPIQFVRGLLACWIAFSVWGYWGQRLMRDIGSPRYTAFMQRQFVWTLVAMGLTLVLGWGLTEYLGGIYKQNVQQQSLGDLDMIFGRLNAETASADGITHVIAASRSVASLLIEGDRRYEPRVKALLAVDSEIASVNDAFILDTAGKVAASSDLAPSGNFAAAPYFKLAMAGMPGRHFEVAAQGKTRDYYTSYPVRDDAGDVVGVAVLKKSLDAFDAGLKQFDVSFFLIDPHGVVAVTNKPDSQFRTLWPLAPETIKSLTPQFGEISAKPLLADEFTGGQWTTLDGSRDYVQRRPIGNTGWSLVIATAPHGIFASRVLGIIITLQMATLALVYLVGRERWVHDNVQLQKRIELEELARNLDYRATTDPLTGLYNRRKFDREIELEMLRAQRYKTPLSLILFDIDHFKAINDTYGHQVGDNVLVDLSGFIAGRIRHSDVLARWGGEEFVILTPACTVDMAFRMAANLAAAIRSHAFGAVGKITCSFGVVEFEDSDTAETLMARVDEALYLAKMNGRDRAEMALRHPVAAPHLAPTA